MAYKFTSDITIMFIAWVGIFSYLGIYTLSKGQYLLCVILIITLISGALVLLDQPDKDIQKNESADYIKAN